MIRHFRENIQGNFAKVFIALICVPFVMFGVDSFFTSSQNPNVAKVNGDSIKLAEAESEVQRLLSERKRQLGDRFDATNIDEESLRPQAIERLVRRKVIEQAVADQGLTASNGQIDKQILQQEIFHSDGQFSANLYKNILRSNNLSPRIYKDLIASDIAVGHLSSALAGTEFLTSDELNDYIKFEYQNRDLSYIVFSSAAEAENIEISAEQIQSYYDDNAAEYMTEETVNVGYVELKLEDFYQPVSEEDIAQAYEQQVAEMTVPTQRKAAHILVADETLAASVEQRLAQGEDFAALAAEVSEDQGSANDGGVLGYTSGELFPAAFEAALAALAVGEVSAPVATEAGVHLIKLLDVKTGDTPRLKDLRAGLETELQKLQAVPAFETALERLKDLAFDSESIAALGQELQLGVQQSGHFTRSGANSGLFASTGLAAMAFSNEVRIDKRISEVQGITAEHYLVAQLQDRELPQQKQLAVVSDLIAKTLLGDAVSAALNEKRDQALASLADGESLETLAAKHEAEVTHVNAVTRRDLPEADRDILFAGFNVNANQVPANDSFERNDGSIAIVTVRNVNYGTNDSVDSQTAASLTMLLNRSYGNEAFTRYDAALNEAASIKLM